MTHIEVNTFALLPFKNTAAHNVRTMGVRENLAILMGQRGDTQYSLWKATGIPQPTISRILDGESKNPATSTLMLIAAHYGVSIDHLLGTLPAGVIPSRAAMDKSQYNVGPVEKPSVKLPLVSWVSAGLPDDANDPYAPGAGGEWVNFDGPFGRQAFCLTVRGDSMVSPDGKGFPDGCVIAVDPSVKARSGDFVVVRFNNNDDATFKQYIIDGPVKLLKPLNSTYPTFQITPDAQMCGVVVEVSMRRNLRNGRNV